MIRSWYALLANQSADSCSLEDLLERSPLEFSRVEGSTPGPGDFSAWVSELRSSHPAVEFQLTDMRTTAAGESTYRTRLTFDRRALDEAGATHVARSEQTWLIRDRPGAPPLVLRVEAEPRLVFPGTGPQIVCY